MSGTNDADDKQTTVEQGTEFKGTMTSNCPVVVRGSLDGDINAPALTVAETGTVVGNVEARSIRSEGVLAGRVDADDIYLSGSVRSDTVIRAKTLEVKLKRDRGKLEVTFGDCILEVGDEPGAEAEKAPQKDAPASMGAAVEAQIQASSSAGAAGATGAKEGAENTAEASSDPSKQGGKKRKDQQGKQGKSDDTSGERPNGKSASIPPPA